MIFKCAMERKEVRVYPPPPPSDGRTNPSISNLNANDIDD